MSNREHTCNVTGPHDSSWIGDQPSNQKPNNTLRLVFQNIHGLGNQYAQQLSILANEQNSLDIDILAITEHCVNIHHRDTLKQIDTTLRHGSQEKTVIQIDSSITPSTKSYLPGCTAILLTGNAVGRLEPNGKGGDDMGRWSFVHLRRQQLPPLTIFSVYQVNPRPTNEIGNTAWHQQRIALNNSGRHDTQPRTAFTDDIIKMIQQFQQQNHEIIVGGDFNKTAFKHNSGLLKIMTHTGLIDVWSHLHPDYPDFNTHTRGSQRIDNVLVSPTICPLIRNMAYAPFQWFTTSNHRAIILDINYSKAFHDSENNTNSTFSVGQRSIRSNDHPRAKIFIDQFYQHLTQNNTSILINKLDNKTASHQDVEKLDRLIGQAGDSSEKQCKRRRPEFYSNNLNSLRIRTSIAHGHLNNLRHQRTSDTQSFQDRLDRANTTVDLADNIHDAHQIYTQLKSELRSTTKQSYEIRERELQDRINPKYQPGTRQHAKRLRSIKIGEATRRAWQTVKHLRTKSGTTQTLNRIDVPASWPSKDHLNAQTQPLEDPKYCTQWISVSNPDDIEHYIRLRNRGHFGQASGTPFTHDPLDPNVNWAADTPTSEEILLGTYHQVDTIDSTPQCSALLRTCKVASELDLLPAELTAEEFEGKIKSWRETTTTSPSGRHLGRYKVLYCALGQTIEQIRDQEIDYKTKQQFIIRAILAVINFCIRTGYTLERWKTIINTMIFKETGNYKIHRLRVIHIYEADFNLILAVKWRQLLRSADMLGLINEGLFGGRPGCEAQSLVFLEELKYDISFCTRRTLFNFDNDATSCYDRIIVSFASLINRKYGLHRQVVAVHANTLLQAQFHLRTTTGISKEHYSHSIQFPIYGSGQGSGNSPAIWLFISSTLCDVHNSTCQGATFTTPDGHETVKISMVAFVDDSTGTINDFQPQTEMDIDSLLAKMQTEAQVWNDLLLCSCGKLELPKCSFHVLRFEFKPNGTPVPMKDSSALQLYVKDSETNTLIQIPPKQPDEPHKTLGHWKSPLEKGNKTQLQALKTTAKNIAVMIATGALSRHGAELSYHAIYCSALRYVLPQCYFPYSILDKAEAQSAPIILAKQGFNRNISKAIRYAPKTMAGCGMIPWRVLQGEGQICLFLKHWRTNTMISKTLRITLAWTQWISGTETLILMDTTTLLPHIEARWMASLRSALSAAKATIQLHRTYVLPSERIGDIHIMDWVTKRTNLDHKSIHIVNYCRLYLHATTISELFDESGKNLLPHMYNCHRPKWFNHLQYMPIQYILGNLQSIA